MRTRPKLCLFILAGLVFRTGASGHQLSFRVYGGLGYSSGGDLNRSIAGWKSYYQGRQGGGFSSSYDLGEMHGAAELGAEAVLTLSRRWSLSLGVGYVRQSTSGEITTGTTRSEVVAVEPDELWTVDFERTTRQNPAYTRTAVPITLSLDYLLAGRGRWTLRLGAGGGFYPGRLTLQESYELTSETISDLETANGAIRFIDRLSTSGDYTEKTKNSAFGLHGRVGLEIELGASSFLTVSVLGRWVEMKGWKGNRHDVSSWDWTTGLWGANSTAGTDERTEEGQYWVSVLKDEKSGASYPVLVFRDSAPSSSSRPANISLSGFSVRLGFGFRFGGKS